MAFRDWIFSRAGGAPNEELPLSGVFLEPPPALDMQPIVSNEELRGAIEGVVWELRAGSSGGDLPDVVRARLMAHLDVLLQAQAIRVGGLIAGVDVTAKPVEG